MYYDVHKIILIFKLGVKDDKFSKSYIKSVKLFAGENREIKVLSVLHPEGVRVCMNI